MQAMLWMNKECTQNSRNSDSDEFVFAWKMAVGRYNILKDHLSRSIEAVHLLGRVEGRFLLIHKLR